MKKNKIKNTSLKAAFTEKSFNFLRTLGQACEVLERGSFL